MDIRMGMILIPSPRTIFPVIRKYQVRIMGLKSIQEKLVLSIGMNNTTTQNHRLTPSSLHGICPRKPNPQFRKNMILILGWRKMFELPAQ
jgi:hypothetical protein